MPKYTLYNYQEEGVKIMHRMKRCLCGDDMGTGKTGSSIVAIERVKATPCLVICPSALKINWKREVENFTNLRPLILTDTNREAFPYYIGQLDLYDVVICNYESLQKYFVKDLGPKPLKLANFVFSPVVNMLKSVIIDESARVKDPSTRQSKIVMGLCQGKEYVIELSGTPVVNNTQDLACQIAILGRIGEFGGYKAFMERYGEGDHLRELHDVIHQKMYFRREKSEVLKDLPELTRTQLYCDLDKQTMEEYYTCLHDLQEYLKEYRSMTDAQAKRRMRMKALVRFMHLRAISGRGKTKAVIEMLSDNPNTQFIVFCEHHDVVDELYANFEGEVVTVTGRDSVMQKQAAIDSFQAGTSRIIVCSIRAAGVGLTLTAASNVIFTELPWTYSDLSQCEARSFRNGQKNAVTSWILMGNNTIDDKLYQKIMDKRSLLSQITGAEDGAAFENEASFDELVDIIQSGNVED